MKPAKSDGGRKPRSFLGSELISFTNDLLAVFIGTAATSAIRNTAQNILTGVTNKVTNPGATVDDAMLNLIMQEFRDNIDRAQLPDDLKQELRAKLTARLLEGVGVLSDEKISPMERKLRLGKLREDLDTDMAQIAAKRRSFQTRVFEMMTQDQQNKLVQIESWFCSGRRQRWLTVRENVESPAVVAAALVETDKVPKSTPVTDAQKEETCETFLKILEGMAAKPAPPPRLSPEQWVDKLSKDNPMVGKVIQSGAVLLGLAPDPIPLMQRGQSEVQYRAQLQPLNLSPKDLEARVRSEMQRVGLEASREAREQGNRSFANSLNSPDAPRFPPMSTSETRDAYSRRMNDFFRSATAREAHVNSECLRVVRLPPLCMRDNEDWINYKARITPYLPNVAELDAHVRSEWIRMKSPEDRAGYTARITPYFANPAALAAQVNAECARLGKP